ncbi:hypothetical protein KKF59_02065 [Patescibacteria group bacterium]|nr:hypothetical protein [Patescibacteria group bacterium]MBU1035045.1 hypothetical protein [Patescibacteria group bacterium]MBU1630087.1 hypothetical protein [Patescibacteria group bacterium]MBU1907895.1 hypothetical protein [Patescibacteria group bacterium]
MKNINIRTIIAGVASLAVIVVAIIGFFLSGTPQEQRLKLTDEQRITDLQNITSAMDQYWYDKRALPPDLETLAKQRNIYISSLTDPTSGEAYAYTQTGASMYDICAAFDTDNEQDIKNVANLGAQGEAFWLHPAGLFCFNVAIQKDRFAPVPLTD